MQDIKLTAIIIRINPGNGCIPTYFELGTSDFVENFVHILWRFTSKKKDFSQIFVENKNANTMNKELLENELEQLKAQLTGDMFQDMEIKDKMHNVEMQIKGVKPMDTHIDCIGCGS